MQPAALYLIAVFGITVVCVGGVVALEVLRPDGVNTQATYTILSVCGPTLAVLIGLIKSIANGQAIEEAKHTAAVTATKADAIRYELPAKTAEAVTNALASREAPVKGGGA
jgi:hypothetical protein